MTASREAPVDALDRVVHTTAGLISGVFAEQAHDRLPAPHRSRGAGPSAFSKQRAVGSPTHRPNGSVGRKPTAA